MFFKYEKFDEYPEFDKYTEVERIDKLKRAGYSDLYVELLKFEEYLTHMKESTDMIKLNGK